MVKIRHNNVLQSIGEHVAQQAKESGLFDLRLKSAQVNTGATFHMPVFQRALSQTGEGVTTPKPMPDIHAGGTDDSEIIFRLTQAVTDGPEVSFVAEESFEQAAAFVAEAASLPEEDLDVTERSLRVERIGTFCKVTSEVLSDVVGTRKFIDEQLMRSALLEITDEVIDGSGSTPHLEGACTVTGSNSISAADHASVLDAFAAGVNSIQSNARTRPDLIVINNSDFLKLRTSRDSAGTWAWPPWVDGTRLFDCRVVPTSLITAGTALVMAASRAGTLHWRSLQIDLTNSHDTDFVSNVISCRVTARVCMTWTRPTCVAKITGIL